MRIYSQDEITKKLNKKNTRNKIFKIIFYPIIILILICNIVLIMQKMMNPTEIPNLLGYKSFIIVSGSMEPNLNIGDMVIIRETKQEKLQKDDIITFSENGNAITHRIVDIINEEGKIRYQTKGDNNNAVDADLVKYENVEGKFVFKIAKVGTIIAKLQNTGVVIILVCGLYIIYRILLRQDNRREARKEKRIEIERKNKGF